jgi:hypothetical protein
MATSLVQTIQDLTRQAAEHKRTLDDALFTLQKWLDSNAPRLTDTDRAEFSALLSSEQEQPERTESDDASLIGSVLRLHAMRLLYRYDETQREPFKPEDDSLYGEGRFRLRVALREAELAVNEAKIDAAIGNAHGLLNNAAANRRWLHDALQRLQSVSKRNLVQMVEQIPMPETPSLTLPQKIMFRIFGIKQEEIARRSLSSLRQIAEMQTEQMQELAQLLVDSFRAADDSIGAKQAQTLIDQLGYQQGKR